MQSSEIRFLFEYDRWSTQRVLDAAVGIGDATWSAANIIDERGLGGSWSTSSAPTSAGAPGISQSSEEPQLVAGEAAGQTA